MILQYLIPHMKSLVQDADFTKAPPYLFGANFRELAKEWLEKAALIQKTQTKPSQVTLFKSATPKDTIPGTARMGVDIRKELAG